MWNPTCSCRLFERAFAISILKDPSISLRMLLAFLDDIVASAAAIAATSLCFSTTDKALARSSRPSCSSPTIELFYLT